MSNYIPLSVPSLKGNEWQYVKECIETEWISSAGKYVELFEDRVAEFTGSKYAVACVNGTSALQVSMRLAGVKPDDEVIVPSLTFIAPVNVVTYIGAFPVFMDADINYNIDIDKIIEFIKYETIFKNGCTYNKTTKKKISAIIPVHVWGNAVLLDRLVSICKKQNIVIVEDASESLGTRYTQGKFSGRHTGTIGKLGCISFNGNKIITAGGGGMILTDDEKLALKAKYLTTQAKDDPIRYIHREIGYNFRLTNIQAALGVAQMEQLPEFLKRKRKIYQHYHDSLQGIKDIIIASVPDYADNNHWINVLQIANRSYGNNPENLMKRMQSKGIQTRPVWALNHLQKPYRNCQSYKIDMAEELVDTSLCLPSSTNLTDIDLDNVIAQLNG